MVFISTILPLIISEKDIVTQLTKQIIDLALIKFDGTTPYIKLDTHWQKIGRKDLPIIIRNIIAPVDRTKIKSSHIAEVIKRITDDISLKIDISAAFWKQQYLMNFKNCIVNLLTGEIIKDRSDYIFDYVIDANYTPNCKLEDAPNFARFITTSAGIENLECILRSTGYIISSLTKAKKAFFVIGPPDGGKSTYLKFVASTVSPELVSSVSFSQMSDSHFVIQYLGKRINVSYDNSPKPMDHEDVFKSVTSCEEIMGRELYESPVVFIPTLKLIYGSNAPFNFKHPDEALYRRMTIIPFEHSVPPEKQDKHLFNKLMNERDIILSLAAKSLKPLIDSGYDFKISDKGKAYLTSRIAMLHSVEDFLTDRAVCDENGTTPTAVIYNTYVEWCKENALAPEDRNIFKEHVLGFNPKINYKKVGPKEKRLWGFKGIRLKTTDELNNVEAQ